MSRRAAVLGMALLLAALSPAAPATAALSIPLTVQEPGAAARVAEPVTSGVPLPPGTQATSWALFDGSREIPVQVTKLRGRVPWILLDFQVDIGSGQSKTLTLKEQAPQPAAADLAPTAPPTRRTVVLAGSDKVIEGVPEKETWEYRGPLRAVLRVDGKFGDVPGFVFSSRYEFDATKIYMRGEYVLLHAALAK